MRPQLKLSFLGLIKMVINGDITWQRINVNRVFKMHSHY